MVFAAGAVAVGLVGLALGLVVFGYPASTALAALWQGAFGSWYSFASATLVRAAPLIVIGLGLAVAFRAGVLNIGGEGQFMVGAAVATWVGGGVGSWPPLLALFAVLIGGAIGGMLWVGIPVFLKLRFGVLEVISTLLLNFVAEALISLLVQGPLQEARRSYPQSDPIAVAARLPVFPGTRLHLGFLIALLLGVGLWLVFTRSRWGFRLRVVGEAPQAAEVTGRINSARIVASALICSAALAGLAGALEVSGVTYALYQNLSPGYGFTAIAVALIARLNPLGIVVAGIGFGALEAGAGGMQRDAGVPAVAVYVVQAVIILVAGFSLSRARAARPEVSA